MSAFAALSVTKFNTFVRNIFQSEELLHNVKIVGEVFGVSHTRGVTYFSLKDEQSSLGCVCFVPEVAITEGENVVVTGSPNFYVKAGKFNFLVTKVEQAGQGLLMQKFLELKEKLQKEGLFDEAHKKPIPKIVKRIGVVTSAEGAVIQDIKNVAWRRNRSVDIVLYNCKVQGNGAENEIAKGIDFFSEYDKVDVVIVARGGGSMEDLSAYNTETVARAAYACKKMLVSAVGHETDFTIIDFVSDLRAPTPSAAAELLTTDSQTLRGGLNKDVKRLSRILTQLLADEKMELESDKNLLLAMMSDAITSRRVAFEKQVQNLKAKLDSFVIKNDYQLKLKISDLNKRNPLDILSLGYAKIEQQGRCVGKLAQLNTKQPIEINFVDGKVEIKTN